MSALDTARAVQEGSTTPEAVVRAALGRIDARDGDVGAFLAVRTERAIDEARRMGTRTDLRKLPLAGVSVAVKDNLAVAGEVLTRGSQAASRARQLADHEVVRRLRGAGAIVIGTTRVPELCLWATADDADVVTRNPWNPERTAGGSSAGSAAAVASGQVDVAIGNDGLGSIRIPAANCGLFGIKPGPGVVPQQDGGGWSEMAENGPLTTTVADAGLLLAVMAERPEFATAATSADPGRLTIAVAANPAAPFGRVDPHWLGALDSFSALLAAAGHRVPRAKLPYPVNPLPAFYRWVTGAAGDADDLIAAGGDAARFQRRTRIHVAAGRRVRAAGLVKAEQVEQLTERVERYFDRTAGGVDVVATPALAKSPIAAKRWSSASWPANVLANTDYAPFGALANIIRWPAMSVPAGVHPGSRTPLAVQFMARPGSEELLLRLAAQIESLRPWQRQAPGYEV